MAEIKVGRGEEPSDYTNHVMVRMTHAGTYQVSGVSNLKGRPEHFLSRHFADMDKAMKTALSWAKTQGISDVHVYTLDVQQRRGI